MTEEQKAILKQMTREERKAHYQPKLHAKEITEGEYELVTNFGLVRPREAAHQPSEEQRTEIGHLSDDRGHTRPRGEGNDRVGQGEARGVPRGLSREAFIRSLSGSLLPEDTDGVSKENAVFESKVQEIASNFGAG